MPLSLIGISGSLRKGSYNTALLRAFAARAGGDIALALTTVHGFPPFNQDEETPLPAIADTLRETIRAADGVLIATPEYNRSLPGVFKNALDWTTRPDDGTHPWKGKPVAVVGASTGLGGTTTAQYDLKRILTYLGARVLGQPEFLVRNAADKFDAAGNLSDEKTLAHVDGMLAAFTGFIQER